MKTFFVWIAARLLIFICAYDRSCLDRAQRFLALLEDYFDLSQTTAEKVMITLYTGLMLVIEARWEPRWIFLMIAQLAVCKLMLRIAKMPRHPDLLAEVIGRISIQVFNISLVLLLPFVQENMWRKSGGTIAAFLYILFVYCISINETKGPGRKRKLSLEKLKALFGSLWVPDPDTIQI